MRERAIRAGGSRGQWPLPVRDLSEVPDSLRSIAGRALGGEAPVHCLLVDWDWRPAGLWRMRVVPSHLLVYTGDRLLVLRGDEDGQPAQSWEMRVDHLLALEWGQVLLHSWIRFIAAGSDGTSEARVEYNTVGWAHVKRLLGAALAHRAAAPAHAEGPEGLALAETLPVKFRNAVRSHLFPWDRLLLVVHQPRERARRDRFPWGWQVRFPETVLAVTSHHVLLLGEDERLMSEDASWGTIATYLPLTCVRRVEVETSADEVRLHIAVGHGRAAWYMSTPWAVGCRDDLRNAAACIERVIGRARAPAGQGHPPA